MSKQPNANDLQLVPAGRDLAPVAPANPLVARGLADLACDSRALPDVSGIVASSAGTTGRGPPLLGLLALRAKNMLRQKNLLTFLLKTSVQSVRRSNDTIDYDECISKMEQLHENFRNLKQEVEKVQPNWRDSFTDAPEALRRSLVADVDSFNGPDMEETQAEDRDLCTELVEHLDREIANIREQLRRAVNRKSP